MRATARLAGQAVALALAGGLALAACGSEQECREVEGITVCKAPGQAAESPARAAEPLDPQSLAAAYLDLSPAPLEKGIRPYLRGQLVVVDKAETGGGEVLSPGSFNAAIPWLLDQDGHGEIVAEVDGYRSVAQPDQVGTVVWLECSQTYATTYNTGAAGYRTWCTATVIDKVRNVIVGKVGGGADPPKRMSCSGAGCSRPEYGGVNSQRFAHYLEALPRDPL